MRSSCLGLQRTDTRALVVDLLEGANRIQAGGFASCMPFLLISSSVKLQRSEQQQPLSAARNFTKFDHALVVAGRKFNVECCR